MGKRKPITWEDVSEEILKEYQELWAIIGNTDKMQEWMLENKHLMPDELLKRIKDEDEPKN
jgi:hypothetical protein